MTVGNFIIDNHGMKTCLICMVRTWANEHRCWQSKGRYDGKYVYVKTPEFVVSVAMIIYDSWISTLDNGQS